MMLYGASGHAKVVIDCLKSCGIAISGVFDDDFNKKELLGYLVTSPYNAEYFHEEKIIISIGDNYLRRQVSLKVNHSFGIVKHSTALISPYSQISVGTVVFHNSIIQSGAIIGNHVIINTAASVDHDCVIENFVHISPNCTLCGKVKVGAMTHIGAGASVIPNLTIGRNCIIGAGTVVIKDIPDNCVVVGNPGRIIKKREEFYEF